MVFFAGLPGTGKSLLVHQLAHLAAGAGRSPHLLQWDVARPAFEASSAGGRYPLADGVTHPVIRKAAGLWARHALEKWSRSHAEPEHLLVGEAPFVGARFIELARRLDDSAEALLNAPACRFAVAVPSAEVRSFLEAQRERRAASPLHPREREDAPPRVLRDLWRDLEVVARQLRVAAADRAPAARRVGRGRAADREPGAYAPAVYRRVYETLLRHRNTEVVHLDTILPTQEFSVYDFDETLPDLTPTEAEAEDFIREAERRYASPGMLDREIARWWKV